MVYFQSRLTLGFTLTKSVSSSQKMTLINTSIIFMAVKIKIGCGYIVTLALLTLMKSLVS